MPWVKVSENEMRPLALHPMQNTQVARATTSSVSLRTPTSSAARLARVNAAPAITMMAKKSVSTMDAELKGKKLVSRAFACFTLIELKLLGLNVLNLCKILIFQFLICLLGVIVIHIEDLLHLVGIMGLLDGILHNKSYHW